MLLFAVIFCVLYLVPVLPVARRIEYVRTLPRKVKNTPPRKITRKSGEFVYVNNTIRRYDELCNTCGGTKDIHPGGSASILNTSTYTDYNVCKHFVVWDGDTSVWSGISVYTGTRPKIASSIAIALALWLPLVITEAAKRGWAATGFEPQKFAVPYHGVESLGSKVERLEREAKVRETEIDRLEAFNEIPNIKEIA